MRYKRRLFFLFNIILILNLFSCIATTNYYTARTLERKKMMILFGLDNVFVQSTESGLQFNKDMPFSPSLGLALGLPYRLETGVRWYFQKTFEGSLRWQVNPKSFRYVDLSTNLHYGSFYLEVNYFKYGLTVSKQIYRIEPFISYYWYSNGEITSLSEDDFTDILKTNRVICFGMALKVKEGYIIPEVNYQYIKNNIKEALVFYSIGFKFDFRIK
jgi:hypothetical protein